MAYANHEQYKTWLSGRAYVIPEAEFDFWATKATVIIDNATSDRLKVEGIEISIQVVNCCCELAEILYREESPNAAQAISSEKVGGHSVSYAVSEKTVEQRTRLALVAYLGNTGLLFTGVR
jgi:hypothetical protein